MKFDDVKVYLYQGYPIYRQSYGPGNKIWYLNEQDDSEIIEYDQRRDDEDDYFGIPARFSQKDLDADDWEYVDSQKEV